MMAEAFVNRHMTNFISDVPAQDFFGISSSEYRPDLVGMRREHHEDITADYYMHANSNYIQNGIGHGDFDFRESAGSELPIAFESVNLSSMKSPDVAWIEYEVDARGFHPASVDTLDSEMCSLEFDMESWPTPTASFAGSSDLAFQSTAFPKNLSNVASSAPQPPVSRHRSSGFDSGERRSTFTKQKSHRVMRKKAKSVTRRATSPRYGEVEPSGARKDSQVYQPQQVIGILEDFVQHFSITKKQASRLVDKFKELIEVERNYWGSTDESTNLNMTTSVPTSLDGNSFSNHTDSELTSAASIYSADDTSIHELSVSSATDQSIYELPACDTVHSELFSPEGISSALPQMAHHIPVDNEATDANSSHDPCRLCGVETLYCCTFDGCGYTVHDYADWKRHEESGKHWPQQRFMCTECPDAVVTSTGSTLCSFCLLPFTQLGASRAAHYLLCAAAMEKAKSFQRCDKLVSHLQSEHGFTDAGPRAAASSYGLNTMWPRQCGFCGVMFQTWEERMQHLGEHFRKGLTKKSWELPFRGPKSHHHRKPDTQRKYDDSDDDDDMDGGSGPSHQGGSRRIGRFAKTGSQQRTQTSSTHQRNQRTGSSTNRKYRNFSYVATSKAKSETDKGDLEACQQSEQTPRDSSTWEKLSSKLNDEIVQIKVNKRKPFELRSRTLAWEARMKHISQHFIEGAELDANRGNTKPSMKCASRLPKPCPSIMLKRYLEDREEATDKLLKSSSIRSPKATGFYDEGPPQSLKKGPSNALPYDLYEYKGKKVEHDLGDAQSSQKGSGHMKGALIRVERLDPSCQARNLDYKRFFVTGRIFSILWTDPYSEYTNSESPSPRNFIDGGLGHNNSSGNILIEAIREVGYEPSYNDGPESMHFLRLPNVDESERLARRTLGFWQGKGFLPMYISLGTATHDDAISKYHQGNVSHEQITRFLPVRKEDEYRVCFPISTNRIAVECLSSMAAQIWIATAEPDIERSLQHGHRPDRWWRWNSGIPRSLHTQWSCFEYPLTSWEASLTHVKRHGGNHGDALMQLTSFFLSSVREIAIGLERIHHGPDHFRDHLRGYHEDVSPANILYSIRSMRETRECAKFVLDAPISTDAAHLATRYFIWTLGCVFLEVCHWVPNGVGGGSYNASLWTTEWEYFLRHLETWENDDPWDCFSLWLKLFECLAL